MMMNRPEISDPRRQRGRACRGGGFSLIEATISVMLVGIVMVGALRTVGAAQRRERDAVDRVIGQQLATSLLNEILLYHFQEPDDDIALAFGSEANEPAGSRAHFDDVDDCHGWTASPPVDRNGSPLPDLSGWTRSVVVQWADPTTLATTSAVDTGLKKITVTTSKGGRVVCSVAGYRSNAKDGSLSVSSDGPDNHNPVAIAKCSDLTKEVGQSLSFNGSLSTDQDGDALSYTWSFGDGTFATGASVSHVYQSRGTYTCKLTVQDARGGVGTASLTAVISSDDEEDDD